METGGNDHCIKGVFVELGDIVVGKIADKSNPKYLLATGFSIITFGLFIMILITNFLELLFVILVIRLGASFYHPIGISWISKNFYGKELDHSMGIQSSFGDSGVFLGFMTTGFIAAQFGWQYPFILWGTLTFLAIIFGVISVKYEYTHSKVKKECVITHSEMFLRVRLG